MIFRKHETSLEFKNLKDLRFFYHVGYKKKYIYYILAKLRCQVECTEIQIKCSYLYVHFTTTHLMLSYYFRSNVISNVILSLVSFISFYNFSLSLSLPKGKYFSKF